MSGYDLHVHSNVSDGALAPAQVVQRGVEAGLDGIALTDHDSTAGLKEARAAAAGGLDVLTGCEVSSRWGEVGVHMLAYFVDVDHPEWVETLEYIRDDRVLRARGMVERLREMGIGITMEQVQAIAQGESIGRPHIAQALVDLRVIEHTPDAFTPEWIGDGGRAYVPKKVASPHETVRVITEAGGVAAVAHPIWIEREGGNIDRLIDELASLGLGALEVSHPDHEPELRARFDALAARHGLIGTSSSDFHGNEHGGVMGSNRATLDVVEALRAASKDAR
ncbi:MAG: PHP domain-containing protein [Actinomycetota bacterium]